MKSLSDFSQNRKAALGKTKTQAKSQRKINWEPIRLPTPDGVTPNEYQNRLAKKI